CAGCVPLHDRRHRPPDQHPRLAHSRPHHSRHGPRRHGYGQPNFLGMVPRRHFGHRHRLRCPPDRHLGSRDVCGMTFINPNPGLTADPLFVGATRPPMRWGVTYSAILFNMVFTMEAFLLTKNLLVLFLAVLIHGVSLLLCARDARFFDLILLWCRTRLPALLGTLTFWRASSYSPLLLDLPDCSGARRSDQSRRRGAAEVRKC